LIRRLVPICPILSTTYRFLGAKEHSPPLGTLIALSEAEYLTRNFLADLSSGTSL
jgi:hypothetical protein